MDESLLETVKKFTDRAPALWVERGWQMAPPRYGAPWADDEDDHLMRWLNDGRKEAPCCNDVDCETCGGTGTSWMPFICALHGRLLNSILHRIKTINKRLDPAPMCEWDPKLNSHATGFGGCQLRATTIVGAKAEFRVCDKCADAPGLARYSARKKVKSKNDIVAREVIRAEPYERNPRMPPLKQTGRVR